VRHTYLKIHDKPDEGLERRCAQIGYAAMLMVVNGQLGRRPLRYLRQVVEPAVIQRNIKFYFNEEGSLVGYVVWARLAEDVEREVLASGEFALHESEWNEGGSFWIVDLVAPYGHFKYIARDLRDTVCAGEPTVRYLRHKGGACIAREAARPRRVAEPEAARGEELAA